MYDFNNVQTNKVNNMFNYKYVINMSNYRLNKLNTQWQIMCKLLKCTN